MMKLSNTTDLKESLQHLIHLPNPFPTPTPGAGFLSVSLFNIHAHTFHRCESDYTRLHVAAQWRFWRYDFGDFTNTGGSRTQMIDDKAVN